MLINRAVSLQDQFLRMDIAGMEEFLEQAGNGQALRLAAAECLNDCGLSMLRLLSRSPILGTLIYSSKLFKGYALGIAAAEQQSYFPSLLITQHMNTHWMPLN